MNANPHDTRSRGTSRVVTASLAGVAVILLLSTAAWRDIDARAGQSTRPAATQEAAVATTPAPAPAAPPVVDSYAPVVERVAPAVVTIRSERKAKAAMTGFPDDPFLRQFFGNDMPQMKPRVVPERSLGSGVIVASDGYILTNNHVVDGAESIKVEVSDGHTYTAKLIGTDPPSDLALLKIDAANLPTATLGNSDQVRVGDVALAIGNPLGVGKTVTMGIVSAKGRQTDVGDGSYEDFIQTDAPINQGNSGGALINTRGEVIGINSQILTPSGGNIGIGFAIPANMARNVMAQLREHGAVRRAKLGVTVQNVSSDIAASLGLKDVRGSIVNSVDEGSAAAKAGIERGDVITKFDGKDVTDTNNLRNTIAAMAPGSRATVTILRDGHEQQLDVTLDEQHSAEPVSTSENGEASGEKFGMTVQPLTPDIARELKLDADTQGLVISDVDPLGKAADAGLQRGDVIEQVNGQPVTTVSQLRGVLERATTRPALLLVNRGGNTFYVTLRAV
jgi:serine protease Do